MDFQEKLKTAIEKTNEYAAELKPDVLGELTAGVAVSRFFQNEMFRLTTDAGTDGKCRFCGRDIPTLSAPYCTAQQEQGLTCRP